MYTIAPSRCGVTGRRSSGTDERRAQYPASDPITPEDTYIELARFMGLDVSQKLREAKIVRDSSGIPALWT